MPSGGYRAPSNPAPVSGPGKMSRRTDGGPAQPVRPVTGLPYGENGEINAVQGQAPMAQTQVSAAQPPMQSGAQPSAPALTPFGAPTERPTEPVTTGNPLGPGAGPEVLNVPTLAQESAQDVQAMRRYLPMLEDAASMEGVPPSFVRFVRHLRDASAGGQ